MHELDDIHNEWGVETNLLAKSIRTRVEDWATLNPAEAAAIRSLAPTPQEILASSKFLKTSFRLRSEDILDQAAVEEELTSLSSKVLYEMSLILRDASLHKSTGKFFTPEVFDVLARVREKCRAMAFLDPLLQRISDALEEFHRRMAGQGRVTDLDALALHALIQQLLDTRGLLRNGLVVPEVASNVKIPVAVVAPAPVQPQPQPQPAAAAASKSPNARASKPKTSGSAVPAKRVPEVEDAEAQAARQGTEVNESVPSQAELEAACLI